MPQILIWGETTFSCMHLEGVGIHGNMAKGSYLYAVLGPNGLAY